ncbi:M4 family metallopeptidase [Sporichthya brevicatena]
MRAVPVMALAAVVAAAGIGIHVADAEPAAPAALVAEGSPASWATQALLQDLTTGPIRVTRDARGLAHLLGTDIGKPIPLPAGISPAADVETQARAHLKRAAALFGLSDVAKELRLIPEVEGFENSFGTDRLVRFQQLRAGLPVLGGELAVVLDPLGALKSVTGELAPTGQNPRPSVSAERARATALAAVLREHPDAHAPAVRASTPELWHLDPVLIGVPDTHHMPTGPVWRMEVSDAGAVREMVLVDARTGTIPLQLDLIMHVNRVVCDRNNQADKSDLGQDCKPTYARAEGQGPKGTPVDVDEAYDYAGATVAFFSKVLGVDLTASLGVDVGDGKRLRSTVRYCPGNTLCSATNGNLFDNAFWNGRGMYYGQGWTRADDIVAHEIAHGVTEKTARLLYLYQSGAINEAMSDIFGELVDLAKPTDDGDTPWVIGEDAPLDQIPVRNMADPRLTLLPPLGQPDRMTAPNYDADLFFVDNGGVHNNSGVGNKAAYLIAVGGSFNGQSITGLGNTKTAVLFFRTLRMLTSGADYADLGGALQQACRNLVGQSGFTAADCTSVDRAVIATEMNKQPPGRAGAPEAGVCPSGTRRVGIVNDGFEKFDKKTWALGDQWSLINDYARSGAFSIYGIEPDRALSSPATLKTKVLIPKGVKPYLRFEHQYRLDHSLGETGVVTQYYDGAVLEYRVNGGSWTSASGQTWENGPTRRIRPDGGSPYVAFGGDSKGYGSSRLDLSFLAGKTVEFRWRVIGDRAIAFDGWTLDDITVYVCGTTKPSDPRNVKVTVKGKAATVKWSPPVYAPAGGVTGYQVVAKVGTKKITKNVKASKRQVKFTKLKSGSYTFTVSARGAGGKGPGAAGKKKIK